MKRVSGCGHLLIDQMRDPYLLLANSRVALSHPEELDITYVRECGSYAPARPVGMIRVVKALLLGLKA